jgi:prevent-host-death family protein
MPAGEFKAKCLAVLDDVAASRREVVITKRGRPVARVAPLEPSPRGPLEGLIVQQGDLVSPIDVEWDPTR